MNLNFVEFCKEEIVRILNCTDKKITTGEQLGLYIAENVQIPEDTDQQDELKQAWATELLEYLEFAYEEGNLKYNPFSEQEQFLKDAVSQGIKIMIQLSDTAEEYWDHDANEDLMQEKQTIISEINEIKSIRFEVIF